ncbi:hypothetical protein FHS18_000977 [Paenibacillus phyllosphaerae]|uniref:DUF4015 domain-containing protein n=1 Tax=Paenibacillus phyllosphaerae TaxID=274593 RepID=A0A7W5FL75_9BACL|nr:putative glycoside hydrolase [Paenibacillus phyllosphaerae]MBB3108925.1 hypothetical protein [Paenibacillus phyllosphaerae]
MNRKVKRGSSTHVKGIYISSEVLMNEERLAKVIDLMFQTGLNAAVIDMKDDQGNVNGRRIRNFEQILQGFKDNGFYLIARVAAFRDPALARRRPTLALKRRRDSAWGTESAGWLDPYKRACWDYVVGVGISAARLGFDEIQFDYVRFPYRGVGPEQEDRATKLTQASQAQTIADFLSYAKSMLSSHDVVISAGVYGAITSTKTDSGIGQKWDLIAQHVDYISPMMYPSLYPKGIYRIVQPENEPYKIIQRGLFDAKRRNQLLQKKGKHAAKIRPWFQDFSSATAKYGLKELQAQIRAAKSQGIHEFLLWNGYANYSYESLQVTNTRKRTAKPARIKRTLGALSKPFFPKRQA